jgi:hypothetical protein
MRMATSWSLRVQMQDLGPKQAGMAGQLQPQLDTTGVQPGDDSIVSVV